MAGARSTLGSREPNSLPSPFLQMFAGDAASSAGGTEENSATLTVKVASNVSHECLSGFEVSCVAARHLLEEAFPALFFLRQKMKRAPQYFLEEPVFAVWSSS